MYIKNLEERTHALEAWDFFEERDYHWTECSSSIITGFCKAVIWKFEISYQTKQIKLSERYHNWTTSNHKDYGCITIFTQKLIQNM